MTTAEPTAAKGITLGRKEKWARRGPLLPALIFTIIITQAPFLATIFYSLHSWNLLRPGSWGFIGLSNYVDVFTDSEFYTAALNTIIVTVGCVLVSLALGVGLALLLDRPFFGRGVVRTMLITPFLIMPVASALLWKTSMLNPTYGLVDAVLGPIGLGGIDWVGEHPMVSVLAALVWRWTPFMMLIVLAGLQSQPRDVLEAARMDGASGWQTFRFMTLPFLRRYIQLAGLLGSIYVVNTFDEIFMMTQGGPGIATTNLPYYLYQRVFQGFDVGQAAALGVVVVVLTIIVATFALRAIFTAISGKEAAE
ncbi:MAG: sugar ABC transporter permease [Saccharopolyspora sp.]|uniref:carbohydrate ABC transporter permease n=1 Tax=Saccharopolyspora TaxID=1835 RepID=UPI001909B955|nr:MULTISPECIES: sugar ABC transporter permease [unclassified Saccharopolyspora]MBK0868513.1 sugar ABC transporter permease [Saccharopolyspora sp. HNM0986]MBQ6640548.1 sugar ABC transporter permease [Saccharopolyspora sp.]